MKQPRLRAVEYELLEAGFRRVYQPAQDIVPTPTVAPGQGRLAELKKGDRVKPRQVRIQHQASFPIGMTEAALIHAMQTHGIGRPSTYASTIATLLERGYIKRSEQGKLISTSIGRQVCEFLIHHFPDLFALDFTAHMEARLDMMADGKASYTDVMQSFWLSLHIFLKKQEKVP